MSKITMTVDLPSDFTPEEITEWTSSMKVMAAYYVKDAIGKRAQDLGDAVADTIVILEHIDKGDGFDPESKVDTL
jgi:hypothetical protein